MPKLSLGVNLNRAKGLTNNTPTKEYIYPSQLDGGTASACWNIMYTPTLVPWGTVRNSAGDLAEIGWQDYLLSTGVYAGKYIRGANKAEILAHCGSGSGWLRNNYDSTGNLRHLTQTNTSPQPRICNNGVVDVAGVDGIPSPVFNGVDSHLVTPVFSSNMTGDVIFNVVKPLSSTDGGAFWKNGDGGGVGVGQGGGTFDDNGNNLIALFENVIWIPTALTLEIKPYLITTDYGALASELKVFVDGVQRLNQQEGNKQPAGGNFYMGGYGSRITACQHTALTYYPSGSGVSRTVMEDFYNSVRGV